MFCVKKKIGLYLGTEPYGGGKFQYSLTMLEAISNLPHEKFDTVVVFSHKIWEKYLTSYDIKRRFVPIGLWGWFFDRIWRNIHLPISLWQNISHFFFNLIKVLINESCDLWIFPAEDTISYQIKYAGLVTIFDLMHRYEPNFPEVSAYGRAKRRDRHYKNICKWARGVFVDSEIGKKQVIESYKIDEKRVHVLPYIAPPYVRKYRITEDFKLRFTLPSKFLFYPAQFWEHKNHKRLILAIAKLKPKIPDLKLVLTGAKKNAYKSIINLVINLGLEKDIIFLEYVSEKEICEIYRRARALIMPTFFGPTNIPPLEAMTLGCPVAVSNIYAMKEQLGNAALFFNPYSVDEIAKTIERLWYNTNLCKRLIDEGFRKIAKWGQPQFNKRLEEIISKVVGLN